jgi:hypothetical protein
MASNKPKTRSRSWDCAGCGKPIRKGASIELREWTRCEGFQKDADGYRGLIKGVGIVLFTHARCSSALKEEGAVVRRLDAKLRAMSQRRAGS